MMLKLLETIAQALIKKYKPTVVCITGSVGKTSTKEAIFSAISVSSYRIRKTSRNYNNDYGVPISVIGGFESEEGFWALFTIFLYGLKQLYFRYSFPQILVIEVGAGKIGEIERMAKWLKPNIVVVTNLPNTPPHLGIFGSREMVIREKKFLVDAMDRKGILIIDKDEVNSKHFYQNFKGKIIFYDGQKFIDDSGYHIIYKNEYDFLKPVGFKIQIPLGDREKTTVDFHGFIGIQNVKAVGIALLVARELGIGSSESLRGIGKYIPECGRLRIIPEKDSNITIIDDSFNASPIAVENSLKTLLSLQKNDNQRRIAVLGDMHKLGKDEEQIHKETGKNEISKVDILITVGNISEVWQEFNNNIFNLNKHFKNSTNAAHYLEKIQKIGDIIHFKGGHLTRLEKAIAILTKCPKKDLVRQEEYYKQSNLELNQESADHE